MARLCMSSAATNNTEPKSGQRALIEDIWGPTPGAFVETSHGATHFILEGPPDGNLVVLQHGIGGSATLFDEISKDLVSKGFRTLRYDFYDRGYSQTDPERYPVKEIGVHPLDFTLDVYVQQMRDVLVKLGLTETDFVHCGHSCGGVMGIGYGAAYPDRVKGLVLIDAVCLPTAKPVAARIADAPIIGNWIVRNMGANAFLEFSKQSCNDPTNPKTKNFLTKQERMTKENERYFAAVRSTNGNCAGMTGSAEPQFRECCSKGYPIHFIWGKKDASVPYSQCVKMRGIAEELGATALEESFDEMPHNVFFWDAKPEECSKSIQDFVCKAF